MDRVLLVAVAAAAGALSRYGLQLWVNQLAGRPTVLGTLIVNLSGAFVLGLFLSLTEQRVPIPVTWRIVGAVGFLGAYTTFSSLMFDVINRVEAGDIVPAVANLTASVILGLVVTYAGIVLGRSL